MKGKTTFIKWYQYSYQVYYLKTGDDISDLTASSIEEVKRENSSNFQKLGGDFDIALFNNEFVLCKSRDLTNEQPFVSFKTIQLGFGICKKIPSRCLFVLTDQDVLEFIKQESNAITVLDSFKSSDLFLVQNADHFF